jgi:hypothetical protein
MHLFFLIFAAHSGPRFAEAAPFPPDSGKSIIDRTASPFPNPPKRAEKQEEPEWATARFTTVDEVLSMKYRR